MKLTKKQVEDKLMELEHVLASTVENLETAETALAKLKGKETEAKVAKTKATKLENKLISLEDKLQAADALVNLEKSKITSLETQITELQAHEATLGLTVIQSDNIIKDYEFIVKDFAQQREVANKEFTRLYEIENEPNLFKVVKRWFKVVSTTNTKSVVNTLLMALILSFMAITSSFGIGALANLAGFNTAAIWLFNVINVVYTSGAICLIGYIHDWHVILMQKFSSK